MKLIDKIKNKFKKEEPVAPIPEVIPEAIPEAPKAPEKTEEMEMMVVAQAPNPQWVYCRSIDHDGGKYAVIIPKRLANKLVKKRIWVEAIRDETGVSYRYVHKA